MKINHNPIEVKRAVKGMVTFQYYRDGELWYSTEYGELFPVPISDIGTATFNASDKGIMFMRYINQWNIKLNKAKNNS